MLVMTTCVVRVTQPCALHTVVMCPNNAEDCPLCVPTSAKVVVILYANYIT